jgi:hypothetical protein
MKKVFLLYSCDSWHSCDSFRTVGVFSTLKILVRFLKKYDRLTEQDIVQIIAIGQTQGRQVNYSVETLDVHPKCDV